MAVMVIIASLGKSLPTAFTSTITSNGTVYQKQSQTQYRLPTLLTSFNGFFDLLPLMKQIVLDGDMKYNLVDSISVHAQI